MSLLQKALQGGKMRSEDAASSLQDGLLWLAYAAAHAYEHVQPGAFIPTMGRKSAEALQSSFVQLYPLASELTNAQERLKYLQAQFDVLARDGAATVQLSIQWKKRETALLSLAMWILQKRSHLTHIRIREF